MNAAADTDLATCFAALGDPTRFAIVTRLMTEGPQSAGALLDVADISAPAVSRHLKVLRQAGVVHQQVDAQRRIYSVAPEAVQAIGRWSMTKREFWEGSLDRLATVLDDLQAE
ncbi:ArsR/SmtB family transcription factor [Nioella nitratireducens]|uniref:ArsR/SmtB family transcription factor n=1 Tax=Nioella nitratireducens TaxID=1287720 RepID=UPI0008FD589B|nr:metalloregulator ArsR/SmtB family transcription factor [Nioella nitratireducens]